MIGKQIRKAAAKALGCNVSDLQQGHVWGGTVYNDGSQDTMHRFFQRGTKRTVVVHLYHDGDIGTGRVEK